MEPNTTSIDDVLATAHLPNEQQEISMDSHDESSEPTAAAQPEPEEYSVDAETKPEEEDKSKEQVSSDDDDVDDYGNERPKQESKTYTEDEVNERINKAVRERLARLKESQPAVNQQPTQQQAQQAADAGFEYNPESNQDWQQQLKQFIRQTNEEVQRETYHQQQTQREQAAQAEFEDKFHNGMSKFKDFRDVVGAQPITDAMTVATRAMKDPAAFLYAASKRHSDELKRISGLQDPYTQMVEIGRLEERMKKAKGTSQAPRPLGQTREDSSIKEPEKRELTIEELIMASDARRLKNMRNRRG